MMSSTPYFYKTTSGTEQQPHVKRGKVLSRIQFGLRVGIYHLVFHGSYPVASCLSGHHYIYPQDLLIIRSNVEIYKLLYLLI
jgi:hypothetical protein